MRTSTLAEQIQPQLKAQGLSDTWELAVHIARGVELALEAAADVQAEDFAHNSKPPTVPVGADGAPWLCWCGSGVKVELDLPGFLYAQSSGDWSRFKWLLTCAHLEKFGEHLEPPEPVPVGTVTLKKRRVFRRSK